MNKRPILSAIAMGGCCLLVAGLGHAEERSAAKESKRLFARDNLAAWCIVPFDAKKRSPEERVAMLKRLGFKRFSYDWRAEHLPTFDREVGLLKKAGIELTAIWFPADLGEDARKLLAVIEKHRVHPQLWVSMEGGGPAKSAEEQRQKVETHARALRPIAEAAAKLGCSVALYNHGGWFGEPENQLAILDALRRPNVGIVYNLHHGHDHLDRFPEFLKKMKPHLLALNLNGMAKRGDQRGRKILPLGQGDEDLWLLKVIADSGWRGPIGILGHTMDDAELRLRDNFDGLDWLIPQLAGKPPGPKPKPRTPFAPPQSAALPGWLAEGRAEYRTPPLTVECRVHLQRKDAYNILVASDTKQSAAHWEIFAMAGNGHFTAYLPGMRPDHVHSPVNICDDQWHDLSMQFEPERVRLYCDGKKVAEQAVKSTGKAAIPGALAFGRLVEGSLGCEGAIRFVRLSRGIRAVSDAPQEPVRADDATVGLWQFDNTDAAEIKDLSKGKNPAKRAGATSAPSSGNHLLPVDPRLQAVLIDRSPSDAYLAVKTDSTGRLFVGGREAVFVFEPDDRGGYRPRRELIRLPPDSLVMGLEIRGNDLYVLTANALYLLPEGRIRRDNLRVKRLLWGLPLDLHVSFHCLAWGPEGDLYLDHGDPLLNYGNRDRSDHWGCWTLFAQPPGTRVPYTGAGAVLRMRPDGSGVRVVAGGLRGPVGLVFDRGENLFTNDNDHESRADLYAPARLLHVTPGCDFAWPRGGMASKSPDRADLLEPMIASLGRGVPCALEYYDEPSFPEGYRNQLLMCRWDRMAVNRYPLQPRGASFQTEEQAFLQGREQARPVGVAVGRGGRVFVTCLYLAGNVVSPHCVSDLVMITRSDDPAAHPFQPFDVVSASAEQLWKELNRPSREARSAAHQEILRRGGALLDEATRRLAAAKDDDHSTSHLLWLAGASGSAEAGRLLTRYAGHARPDYRRLALRVLIAFPKLNAPPRLFAAALADADPQVRLAALAYFFQSRELPPLDTVSKLACSEDMYLRQTAVRLLASRFSLEDIRGLLRSTDAALRLGGVLAAGWRLTVPPAIEAPPKKLPLFYPANNAFFHGKMRFADTDDIVDLRDHGRVGSYTRAERWKALEPNAEEKALFNLLNQSLDDRAVPVRLQAAYYLSLLRDPRSEPRIAAARRAAALAELSAEPDRPIRKIWLVGPFADGSPGGKQVHPPEQGTLDLSAEYVSGDACLRWQQAESADGRFREPVLPASKAGTSSYLHFRLQSIHRQRVLLTIRSPDAVQVWHNGRSLEEAKATTAPRELLLDVQPGSNDILIRVRRGKEAETVELHYRAHRGVTAALPEKLDASLLAQRLREGGEGEKIAAAFRDKDWNREALRGDAARGRALFGSLGCVKCHALVADQAGGGAPSLAEARKRFTVPYLVESILLPSKQIAEPFRATSLVLRGGRQLSGLIVTETAESVELLLPDATRKTIGKKDIEERSPGKLSPMPAGLVRSPDELRDLLTYLLSDAPVPP
jgi:putative heme-binding domain-containing protein